MIGLPSASAAVVFGSGLAAVPDGLDVTVELPYAELGWPTGGVPGHEGRLLAAGETLLAFGRGHSYEGFTEAELERPVRDLAAVGVRRLVLLCACGALAPGLEAGHVLAVHTVVDLRFPVEHTPPGLAVCSPAAAESAVTCLAPDLTARAGTYVAVAGPQYETPAEAAWLAGLGDAAGMSAAPEVRAAAAEGVDVRLLAVVTNRAGAALGHDEVLAAGERVRRSLGHALTRLLDPGAARPA
jgi:purine nucleoside phosphorylase